MNRSIVLSACALALAATLGNTATANTVNVSLDIFYSNNDGDPEVDATAQGTWQLYATADEEGLAGLATQITGIAGLDATTNRPMFKAPTGPGFHTTYDSGTKDFDDDTDNDASTLEMLFGQVPVAAPGPQDLLYDVGKLGGTTSNTDELGVSVDTSGNSMTDAVLLAFGKFGANSTPALSNFGSAFTDANVFTVEGTPSDPPLVGSILSAGISGTLNLQTRTNLATRAGDVNLNGLVNAADAGIMFANWDGGAAATWMWQEGDVSGDKFINAVDAGQMFAAWTGDPGPAPAGTAVAEYNPQTGEIVVSVAGVVNWYVESASFALTGDEPTDVDGGMAGIQFPGGGAVSNNPQIIGETTGFALMNYTDFNLGNVAAAGLPAGDLTVSWNTSLGGELFTIPVVTVPEPATLALAALGLCGVLATRRRRAA